MDKSVDSIGSCSLDVDADSSDISDTSGSLNFPTPISIKDITQEFTANIHERCTVRKVHMQTILNQPTTSPSALRQITVLADENDKKPSYLNLACCVNGYSNITTYDSKIRQDINKSREVSPIRPSSSSIQYCKKNDCLAPPALQKIMPNGSLNVKQAEPQNNTTTTTTTTSKFVYCQENNGHQANVEAQYTTEGRQRSFIQQRVERLYGPGALAQGFYSQKKMRDSPTIPKNSNMDKHDKEYATSELTMKFKQLSPSKDYGEFRRKINGTESGQTLASSRSAMENNNVNINVDNIDNVVDNNNIDLPVLRHLSQEFRAQLPKISPKRNVKRSPPANDDAKEAVTRKIIDERKDEVDHNKQVETANLDLEICESMPILKLNQNQNQNQKCGAVEEMMQPKVPKVQNQNQNQEPLAKDGHYFLKLLKSEQDRLLSMACVAEKHIESLTGQSNISEEIFGLLRSAAGKARLFVSQKMKQFEGLCHKNINDVPGQKFPTTNDDLQGFWDMVNLQVDHIDSIFAELETLKNNDWKKKEELIPIASPKKKPSPSRVPVSKSTSAVSNGNSATKSQSNIMSAAALKRESQRKQLMEMKRKNKLAMTTANAAPLGTDNKSSVPDNLEQKNAIEIFINENQS